MGPVDYRVYVIHLSEGYEDRRLHIEAHLPRRGVPQFDFITEGDPQHIEELNLSGQFEGEIVEQIEAMSCAYKHIVAYRNIVKNQAPFALILEDDVVLKRNFVSRLNTCLSEIDGRNPVFVSLEATNRRVPWRLRDTSKQLYRCNSMIATAGYVINYATAKILCSYFSDFPATLPIDYMIPIIAQRWGIDTYWAEPPLLKQGSKNGMFHSTLSHRKRSKILGNVRWHITKMYQDVVVSNLSPRRRGLFAGNSDQD